jgi:hypothetical protein
VPEQATPTFEVFGQTFATPFFLSSPLAGRLEDLRNRPHRVQAGAWIGGSVHAIMGIATAQTFELTQVRPTIERRPGRSGQTPVFVVPALKMRVVESHVSA